MATKEREEIKGMTKQKMARHHTKEGGRRREPPETEKQWKALMEG